MEFNQAPKGIVFVDADNTLWDTDGVFASAQLRLLGQVEAIVQRRAGASERLDYIRQIDQSLAVGHHLGLRYPPGLLAVATADALLGKPISAAGKQALKAGAVSDVLSSAQIEEIEHAFIRDIKAIPPLLDGVRAGLEQFHSLRLSVLILTEGAHDRVKRTADYHGLDGLFTKIIEAPKTERLFRRVRRLTGEQRVAVMIGDQLKSDIRPAKEAGVTTIYIPGRFKPKWELEERQTKPDFQVETFDQVVAIVERACAGHEHSFAG